MCKICKDTSILDKEKVNNVVFLYPKDLKTEFSENEILPLEFKNLKKNVKRHIPPHTNEIKMPKRDGERKVISRNELTGMNLGKICMKLYLKRRPYSDYEDDVLLHEMNGAVVAEINHSRKFPAAFRPFLSAAVTRRVKNFVNLRLTQTGHLPAINITADKATYKHRTRQFISCVTLVPGADDIHQVISFGQPIVKGHKGFEITQNIKEDLDIFGIKSCQIEGGSFDGQYFHSSGVRSSLLSPIQFCSLVLGRHA